MKMINCLTSKTFGPKAVVKSLLDTPFTKEVGIYLQTGQMMKEHSTPYPIVIYIIEGAIEFGANGQHYLLSAGDMLDLEGGVPHDLKALEQSIVRLTLVKSDQVSRVKDVAEKV